MLSHMAAPADILGPQTFYKKDYIKVCLQASAFISVALCNNLRGNSSGD